MNFTCVVIVAEIKKSFQTEIKHHFRNLRFFFYHWVDTSAGGLFSAIVSVTQNSVHRNWQVELLTLSENRKSEFILGFARLVLRTLYSSRVVFCRLLFVPLAFGHCTVCPHSNYAFWLPFWYFQTFLIRYILVWQ